MIPTTIAKHAGDDPPIATLYYGQDARQSLRQMPEQSVHCVVTSPPYWALRAYQEDDPQIWGGSDPSCTHEWDDKNNCTLCKAWRGHLGQEPVPDLFVSHLVELFREVKRVLRDDGTLWLNLGDTAANKGLPPKQLANTGGFTGARIRAGKKGAMNSIQREIPPGMKAKDLVGIPWMVAFALRADGWYLRQDIIWSKANAMPLSVKDKCTPAHEYVFMLTKQPKYFYDQHAALEPLKAAPGADGKNRRTVWEVNTQPYKDSHMATFPEKLVEPMIQMGTSYKGCCGACKAPYKRVLGEKQAVNGRTSGNKKRFVSKDGERDRTNDHVGSSIPWGPSKTPTVDWAPTCNCACPEISRCVVLDPFSGSGTTGLVALNLNRDYIGLDLNPDYLPEASHRLSGGIIPRSA